MGVNSFFTYGGGRVSEINSDVSDYVFSDINKAQISKRLAWLIPCLGKFGGFTLAPGQRKMTDTLCLTTWKTPGTSVSWHAR